MNAQLLVAGLMGLVLAAVEVVLVVALRRSADVRRTMIRAVFVVGFYFAALIATQVATQALWFWGFLAAAFVVAFFVPRSPARRARQGG